MIEVATFIWFKFAFTAHAVKPTKHPDLSNHLIPLLTCGGAASKVTEEEEKNGKEPSLTWWSMRLSLLHACWLSCLAALVCIVVGL